MNNRLNLLRSEWSLVIDNSSDFEVVNLFVKKIVDNQEFDEKSKRQTIYKNGIGCTKSDSRLFTNAINNPEIAKNRIMDLRKRIKKYWKQF